MKFSRQFRRRHLRSVTQTQVRSSGLLTLRDTLQLLRSDPLSSHLLIVHLPGDEREEIMVTPEANQEVCQALEKFLVQETADLAQNLNPA